MFLRLKRNKNLHLILARHSRRSEVKKGYDNQAHNMVFRLFQRSCEYLILDYNEHKENVQDAKSYLKR